MGTLLEQEQNVSDAVSNHSIKLSRHVRLLAADLCEKAKAGPFASETLMLSDQVDSLCDYIDRLHESVDALLGTVDAVGVSAVGKPHAELTAEEEKAMQIQREIHELNPTAKDTIKALFMWRDAPAERLRDRT